MLLTKADRLNRREAHQALQTAQAALSEWASEQSDVGVTLCSALKKNGVSDVAETLRAWALAPAAADQLRASDAGLSVA